MAESATSGNRDDETFEATFNYIEVKDRAVMGVKKRLRNGRKQNFRLRGDAVELLSDIYLPVKDFSVSPLVLRKQIQAQMSNIAKALTGAYATAVFLPLVRSETAQGKEKNAVEDLRKHVNSGRPHDIVHNDYAVGFKRFLQELDASKLRYFLAASKQDYPRDEDLIATFGSAKRVVVVQFWASAQPEGTVIEHHPLAVCAPRSVKSPTHVLPVPLPEYGGVDIGADFHIYLANASHADQHEWFHFPKMTRNEMLAWIGYDSLEDPLLPPFHSAFEYPEGRGGTRPRESIEVRVLCLLDHSDKFYPERTVNRHPHPASAL